MAKAVAEALGWTREAARELCRRCHVEPESPLAKTSWTERKLIDFELATVSADLVVVDDTGCDPMGVRRFTAHIRNALSSHRFAVLGLNYPKVSSRGAWPQPWHDENWADVRLTVTHVV